jgi:hypothetical protein
MLYRDGIFISFFGKKKNVKEFYYVRVTYLDVKLSVLKKSKNKHITMPSILNFQASKDAIPVRYEMKGYNSLLGSHYDHYFLDYEIYSPEKPEAGIFEIEASM